MGLSAWSASRGARGTARELRTLRAPQAFAETLNLLESAAHLLDHAEDEALGPCQCIGERLVRLYETYSLGEALAAMELLLAHAWTWRPDKQVERDAQNSIFDEDEGLPFFVYVLGDSIHEFPGESIAPG